MSTKAQNDIQKVNDALLKRDEQRDIGEELLEAVKDIRQGREGGRLTIEPNEVALARKRTGLSQQDFARALRISHRTLQHWEQGRRHPSGAAVTLLKIVARHPALLKEVS